MKEVVYEDDAYDYEDDFKLSEWSEYEREGIGSDDSPVNAGSRVLGATDDIGTSEPNNEIKEKRFWSFSRWQRRENRAFFARRAQ